jgi:chromosome segregation ATPase
VKLAIEHIEQSIAITEREQADAQRCLEQCQTQWDDASARVSHATGKLNELRAALVVLKATQNVATVDVTNLQSTAKRLEKRRAS